jgi:hypothetical protein
MYLSVYSGVPIPISICLFMNAERLFKVARQSTVSEQVPTGKRSGTGMRLRGIPYENGAAKQGCPVLYAAGGPFFGRSEGSQR